MAKAPQSFKTEPEADAAAFAVPPGLSSGMAMKAKLLAVFYSMRRSTRRKRDQEARIELIRVVCGERDEQAFVAGLRRFVEYSDLSLTQTATLMGVSPGALKNWIEGTTSLRPAKLLEIRGFLKWYAWRDEVIKTN